MASFPLVSIIIPTYNRAEWLPLSINSIISQTYSRWELIVWDDGSTDNTEEVIKSFVDDRIKYYKNKNHGVSHARNKGIEKSTGEYIAFLDSDDEWNDDKLANQIDILKSYSNLDCIFSNYKNKNLSTGEIGDGFTQCQIGFENLKTIPLQNGNYQITAGMPESLAINNFLLIIQLSTLVLKKNAFDKVGKFNENLQNCEDSEFFWRMGLTGLTMAYSEKIMVTRNKPPGSLSSGGGINHRINNLNALDSCSLLSKKFGRDDLLKGLTGAYRNALFSLLHEYNNNGDKINAIISLGRSLKYGIKKETFLFLSEILIGQFITDRIRNSYRFCKGFFTH